jgi:hypothetical protein
VCDDCTSDDPAFVGLEFTSGTARDVLVWGTAGMVGGGSLFAMENVGAIGGTRAPTSGGGLVPRVVDGFSFRDLVFTYPFANLTSSSILDARNGVISNALVAGTVAGNLPTDGTLENIAFVDIATTATCTGSCYLMHRPTLLSSVLRRVAFVHSPGMDAGFDYALRSNATSAPGLVLDGVLVDGWQGPLADHAWNLPAIVMTSATFGGGPCFHDNVSDGTSAVLDNLPPTAVRGVPPGFVDPASGRFDTLPGSAADVAGCGVASEAEAPGVRGHPWAWRISGLPPERMADDPDGDGVPEAPGAPRCASGGEFGCGDVCPAAYDPLQRDTDGDGIGDGCDDRCVGEVTAITQVLPATVRIGSVLEIRGTGFGPAASVRFGKEVVDPIVQPGRLLAIVPPLPIGSPVPLQVVNPEGCRSLEQVIVVPEVPLDRSCGLIGAELLALLWLRRSRGSDRRRSGRRGRSA